jgi:hypothetical protein
MDVKQEIIKFVLCGEELMKTGYRRTARCKLERAIELFNTLDDEMKKDSDITIHISSAIPEYNRLLDEERKLRLESTRILPSVWNRRSQFIKEAKKGNERNRTTLYGDDSSYTPSPSGVYLKREGWGRHWFY